MRGLKSEVPQMPLVLARRTDPATSHQAAASIESKVAKLEGIVLQKLRDLGQHGATSEEMAGHLGLDRVTVSPRFRPLADRGMISESGQTRRGSSGRPSIVWVAV